MIIKKNSAILSSQEKKDPYNIPHRGQGIGAINCCCKDLHPRDRSYPRFLLFYGSAT